jgi:cytochrome c553
MIRTAAGAAAGVCFGWSMLVHLEAAPRQPDVSHGAVVVAQGTPAGAQACAQCHAFNGASDGSGAFPRIAGQSAFYLANELREYAADVRSNAIMSPIAAALTPDDIADVSAYYATISAPFLPLGANPALVKRGEELAKVGNAQRRIQACDNCHGPGGVGEPPAIPYLAGQYGRYIEFQLQMWQSGTRKNSQGAMALLAKELDGEDIAAVAAYYQQVRATAVVASKN